MPDTVPLKHQGHEVHTVRYPSLLCWRLESDTRDSLTLAAWWTHPEAFFSKKKKLFTFGCDGSSLLHELFSNCKEQGLLFIEKPGSRAPQFQ